MEGKYFDYDINEENTKHARVIFYLDNNRKLIYDDSRCFGILKLSSEKTYLNEKEISKLGPEPFDIIDINYLYNLGKKSSLPIKTFLLDQSVMTGLGNIYVDETLFLSRIHPLTTAKEITLEQWQTILDNSVKVLNKAILEGGSTIKSYHPGKNIDGNFQVFLKAYGRKGEACLDCGTTMKFIKVNGRGTTYCPNCQGGKKDKIIVGITGKIASGKSTILEEFRKAGFDVISSDVIVKNLYDKKSVAELISKAFSLTFNNNVDKSILREYLVNNPNDIEKLNQIIHPLVKQEIFNFIKHSKSKIIAVEVPLLFEAHMEGLFDYIIGSDISDENQNIRLNLRDKDKASSLKVINANHKFDKNKKYIDFIIDNNYNLDTFLVNIQSIISILINHLN